MKHDYNGSAAADSIATTTIGFAQAQEFGGSGFIDRVVVQQESDSDAEWNVLVDGSNIFASTQSVASSDTSEEFIPDQNRNYTGAVVDIDVDVTASSTTSGNLIVGVLTDDGREARRR